MKGLEKTLIRVSVYAVLAVAIFLLFRSIVHRDSKIADTATIVTNVRAMSSLTTAVYYNETAISSQKTSDLLVNLAPVKDNEICLIAKGKVRAGIDLSKITSEDLLVRGDTLELRLPKAEIFDVIVNPSDVDIFVEDGKWSHEEISALESRAAAKIRAEALSAGILDKAEDSARKQLFLLMESFGYKEIIINSSQIKLENEKDIH